MPEQYSYKFAGKVVKIPFPANSDLVPIEYSNNSKKIIVSIIILVHNQLKFTRETLKSIKKYTKIPCEIIIIDNNSADGTFEYVSCLPGIKVIRNSENKGFPAGCNQGIVKSEGEFILFLNNDVIVTENWLENLLKYFISFSDLGAIGPISNYSAGLQMDRLFDSNSVILNDDSLLGEDVISRYSKEIGLKNKDYFMISSKLTGFCLLTKREVIEKVGGFDERFGRGNYEDDDFCVRISKCGFLIGIARDVFIYHFGSKSFDLFGREAYLDQLNKNEDLFIDKWGAEPKDILIGSACLNEGVPIYYDLPKNVVLHQSDKRCTISLCMIVKNEEKNIAKCIGSVYDIVDEIIVVDTGSDDRTKEIAVSFGAAIYDYQWSDNFSDARNYSLARAEKEWILVLDADEIIKNESIPELLRLVKNEKYDALSLDLHNKQGMDSINKIDVLKLTRLFKNNKLFRYEGLVHEQIRPSIERASGNILYTSIKILHSGYSQISSTKIERNLHLLEKALTLDPNDAYILYQVGVIFQAKKDQDRSISAFLRAIDLYHKNKNVLTTDIYVKLLIKMSQIYLEKNSFEESFKYIRMAFEIEPGNLLVLYIISSILFVKNQYIECLRILNILEKNILNSNEMEFDLHQIYVDKGNCNYLLRRYNSARSEYEKALKINERSGIAGYNLANTYFLTGEDDKAVKVLEITLNYNPDFPEAQKKMKEFKARQIINEKSITKE